MSMVGFAWFAAKMVLNASMTFASPHDAETIGDDPARLLIIYPRGGHSELTRSDG